MFSQLRHPRLFIQHFIVINDHVFYEAHGGVTAINDFKDAAPGQILHRLQEEDPDAKQQPQIFHFAKARGRLWFLRRTAMTPRAKINTASK